MSCPCPSGYTPTIDSDDCIYTVTAATSGGTSFYTATTAVNNTAYNGFGVIFYDDITNLSFPIFNTGTTSTVYTQNGYPLTNTQYIVDQNGVIPNILAGGQGIMTSPTSGPPYLVSNLWGNGTIGSGRLNNAGIWATSASPSPPYNEYIGFSYCLDIPSGGTYFIGLSGDDYWRLKINGELIYNSIATFPGTSLGGFALNTAFHQVFPFYFNSGLNIIEMECLNLPSTPGAFVAEIYSGSVTTLSAYTTTIQLSADTIFSTLDFIGQDIPLSNSGYTCPSGYTLYNCTGSPYCIQINRQDIVNYCVNDTGLGYDDYFKYGGIHNSEPYWTGETNGYVIFYSTGGTWCLSTVLDGTCLLEGPYPCNSVCPDLCDTYVFSGACPTPTPTPTVNCSVLDFTAIFDCEVTPTPSVTPTLSLTPTETPTPTPTEVCGGRAVDVTITGYTPTPTATFTPTPTLTPEVTRPCAISGSVTYNTIDSTIICPMSKEFKDCLNGATYYTTSAVPLPSGGTIATDMIFKANVNGESKCIYFVGMNLSVIGIDNITLVDGPIGYYNLGDCILCTPDITPTPTPTPTPTYTPTTTPTPTPSVMTGFYVYKKCIGNEYIVQSIPGPTLVIGEVFSNPSSEQFNSCWEYIGFYYSEPNLPLGSLISTYSSNIFPDYGYNFYTSCKSCGGFTIQ